MLFICYVYVCMYVFTFNAFLVIEFYMCRWFCDFSLANFGTFNVRALLMWKKAKHCVGMKKIAKAKSTFIVLVCMYICVSVFNINLFACFHLFVGKCFHGILCIECSWLSFFGLAAFFFEELSLWVSVRNWLRFDYDPQSQLNTSINVDLLQ